jgi:hypothetical protein
MAVIGRSSLTMLRHLPQCRVGAIVALDGDPASQRDRPMPIWLSPLGNSAGGPDGDCLHACDDSRASSSVWMAVADR